MEIPVVSSFTICDKPGTARLTFYNLALFSIYVNDGTTISRSSVIINIKQISLRKGSRSKHVVENEKLRIMILFISNTWRCFFAKSLLYLLKTGPRVLRGFLYVSYPHELNFELLMKTLERKIKRNAWKLSYILLFWNTVFIRSCPVVYVIYNTHIWKLGKFNFLFISTTQK